MKVAIVHDQLQEFGGAERVLVVLKSMYPEADIYTSFYNPESLGVHRHLVDGWNIITSWADKVPFLKQLYSPLRFITPYIWESMNFDAYDLVISSSGSYMCKGVMTKPKTVHICYIHHPPRYLHYYETAVEWQKYFPIRVYGHLLNHCLRLWDYQSSQRPDYFIANSIEVKKRVEKFYRRESDVIYPPVLIPEKLPFDTRKKSDTHYFLTVSRLARAKHIDILVQAANHYGFKLKVVGSGRDEQYLRSIAGSTVEILGAVPDRDLVELYHHATAFLFSAVDEEFGIAPIEAMGHSVPVIAHASGGLIETIQEGENGYLFSELTRESLYEKVKLIENMSEEKYKKMSGNARKSAEKYSLSEFKKAMETFIKKVTQ